MTREQLLDAIRREEGYTPRAAWDYKQHSVGYGTRARFPGEVIDREEAERRLQEEVSKAEAIVDRFAPNLDPGTRAALSSLTYNAGDAWTREGLGRAIQAGDIPRAREIFLQYNRAAGQPLPGLVARRQREAGWIGAAPATPQTPQPPDGMDAPTYGAQKPAQPVRVAEAPTVAPTPETAPAASPEAPKGIADMIGDLFREPEKQERGPERDALQLDDIQHAQIRMPQPRRVDLSRLRAALQSRRA